MHIVAASAMEMASAIFARRSRRDGAGSSRQRPDTDGSGVTGGVSISHTGEVDARCSCSTSLPGLGGDRMPTGSPTQPAGVPGGRALLKRIFLRPDFARGDFVGGEKKPSRPMGRGVAIRNVWLGALKNRR